MQERLIQALRMHGSSLRRRWERRLRALPSTTALASPDTLVHLMESTLERIFDGLDEWAHTSRRGPACPACPCGLNPLIAFYITAEEALLETLFVDEAAWPALTLREREEILQSIRQVLQRIAFADIRAFCSLCQRKCPGPRVLEGRPWTDAGPVPSPVQAVAIGRGRLAGDPAENPVELGE